MTPAPQEVIDRTIRSFPPAGLLVLSTILTSFLVGGAATWQLAIATAITIGLCVVTVRVVLLPRPAWLTTSRYLTAVLTMQTVLSIAIGGLASFGFIIVVPTSIFATLVTTRREWMRIVAVPFLGILAVGIAQLQGLDIVPPAFDRSSGNTDILIVACGLVTLVALFGGVAIGRQANGFTIAAGERTRAAQRALADELAHRNDRLVGLTGAIAHELKNPLAAIHGLSKLMVSEVPSDDPQRERLEVLVEESERMTRIVTEFLNFSRPISDLTSTLTALGPLVREVATAHEGLARDKQVRIEAAGDLDAAVVCDPRKVKQVVINLVQNALEASPAEGVISLTVSRLDGEVLVAVTDDGPGLSAELADRAFDAGATTKGAGTGLGLSIARTIAEQHGGTVTLTNREKGGCRAELRLPAGTDSA